MQQEKTWPVNYFGASRSAGISSPPQTLPCWRYLEWEEGWRAKEGSKGGAAAEAPKASMPNKEDESITVVGANILKDGAAPKILLDSKEYPDWLSHLLDEVFTLG